MMGSYVGQAHEPLLPNCCLHVILQEAETEGQVRINGAYGVAYTPRELHRRSHGGTHAEADRGPLGRPSS